jgi:large exoprotein involved in heme utilization and adhesion
MLAMQTNNLFLFSKCPTLAKIMEFKDLATMHRTSHSHTSKLTSRSQPPALFKLTLIASVMAIVTHASAASAVLPTEGNIVAGSGSISQTASSMTITQTTAKMAANWQTFNIGVGNSVNFVQPSASSVALNQVLGSDVSVIYK